MSEHPDLHLGSHDASHVEHERRSDVRFEMQWVALAIPLGVAMIFSMAGLVCLWLDVLI